MTPFRVYYWASNRHYNLMRGIGKPQPLRPIDMAIEAQTIEATTPAEAAAYLRRLRGPYFRIRHIQPQGRGNHAAM